MKRLIRNVLLLSLTALVMVGCGKDDDDSSSSSTPTKTGLLTGPIWKLTNMVAAPPWDTLFTYNPDPCEDDDRISFSAGGTGVFDPGTIPCDSTNEITESFTWEWMNAAETELRIIDASDTTTLSNVVITTTTMTTTQTEDAAPLPDIVLTLTFTAQ